MKILALDTSTLVTTCAVIEDGLLLGEYSLNLDMSHSENLAPMVEELLSGLKMSLKEIDLYTVALGPGSFTGLRIGLATMKAFAHVNNKPIVGVATLEALAFNLPNNRVIVPMIDARRDRVYTGIYSFLDGKLEIIKDEDVVEIDELLNELKGYDEIIVNGNGSSLYKDKLVEVLGEKVKFANMGNNLCRASSVGELGFIRYGEGVRDDYFTIIPEYLRKSQAEREFGKNE